MEIEAHPEIRSRPELLDAADLEAIDAMVAGLVEREHLSATTFMGAVTVAIVGITVDLIRYGNHTPEDAAGRALAVAELVLEGWAKHFRRRAMN
jgi:hypothetical protein